MFLNGTGSSAGPAAELESGCPCPVQSTSTTSTTKVEPQSFLEEPVPVSVGYLIVYFWLLLQLWLCAFVVLSHLGKNGSWNSYLLHYHLSSCMGSYCIMCIFYCVWSIYYSFWCILCTIRCIPYKSVVTTVIFLGDRSRSSPMWHLWGLGAGERLKPNLGQLHRVYCPQLRLQQPSGGFWLLQLV